MQQNLSLDVDQILKIEDVAFVLWLAKHVAFFDSPGISIRYWHT